LAQAAVLAPLVWMKPTSATILDQQVEVAL